MPNGKRSREGFYAFSRGDKNRDPARRSPAPAGRRRLIIAESEMAKEAAPVAVIHPAWRLAKE